MYCIQHIPNMYTYAPDDECPNSKYNGKFGENVKENFSQPQPILNVDLPVFILE